MALMIIFAVFSVLYMALVTTVIIGWQSQKTETENKQPAKISVVVPMRNERKTIGRLLKGLEEQRYPKNKFEVIIVDDHSMDNSYSLVGNLMKSLALRINLIKQEEGAYGKKAALKRGIKSAAGKIIVTTDADCSLPPLWLHGINASFCPGVKMVLGPVAFFDEGNLFSKLQSMEFASLIGVGASTLYFGIPSMCNGANLAFEKKVFDVVQGYQGNEHLPSGDDEFLLHKVHARYPNGVKFMKNEGAVVRTGANDTWRSFFYQRKRWASKWKFYNNWKTKLLAIFIFIFYLVSILVLIKALVIGQYWGMFLPFFLLKMMFDGYYLFSLAKFLKIRFSVLSFVLLSFGYPFYALFFGMMGSIGGYHWKGREYR